jgi:hypothetical protein
MQLSVFACESHSTKPLRDDDLIQVIIETPAQSRDKFAFDSMKVLGWACALIYERGCSGTALACSSENERE